MCKRERVGRCADNIFNGAGIEDTDVCRTPWAPKPTVYGGKQHVLLPRRRTRLVDLLLRHVLPVEDEKRRDAITILFRKNTKPIKD